jgi:putative aldouronate transport system permease protein
VATKLYGSERYSSRLLRNHLVVDIIIHFILLLFVIVLMLPVWSVILRSISPRAVVEAYPLLLWPKEISLEAFKYIAKTPKLINSFNVTVFITLVGTILNLIFTVPAAYALSKNKVPGVRFVMVLIIITMLFSAGIIPLFLVVNGLGLIDSIWAMIIPSLVGGFNLILVRNFIWNLPKELEESACLDGASDAQIVVRIILPLSTPIVATVGLFCALGHWNEFYSALFFVNDPNKWPLQLVLRSIIFDSNLSGMSDIEQMLLRRRYMSPENIQAACIVFATLPVLLVYPLLQKYFTKGIMMGAVKG